MSGCLHSPQYKQQHNENNPWQIHISDNFDYIVRWNSINLYQRDSLKINPVSPLSPSLIQAEWSPLLTSWPEDSAVGPPHCHNYDVASCARKTDMQEGLLCVPQTRGLWSEDKKNDRDSVAQTMQGGGERQAMKERERPWRETKNSNTHSGSYMIRHVALPLSELTRL